MTPSARLVQLAHTVRHEGALLYPYEPSALKNQKRFAFGEVFPAAAATHLGERSALRTEVLLKHPEGAAPALWARVCFLFSERAADGTETLREGGVDLRLEEGAPHGSRRCAQPVEHGLSLRRQALEPGLSRLRAEVCNLSTCTECEREPALAHTMLCTQIWLVTDAGQFVSTSAPPTGWIAHAEHCDNRGLWPALVGGPGACRELLAAPIIVGDHACLAPETALDLHDGTEIDAMLRLRLSAASAEERRRLAELAAAGRVPRELASVGAPSLDALVGRMTGPDATPPVGAAVRLRPSPGRDSLDLALAGRTAVVQRVEQDFEGRTQVVVEVDGDPGRDMGRFGHQFFFAPEELQWPPGAEP